MLKQSLECKYMYCKYLCNVKTYEAEIWYAMLTCDADFCYDIDIWMVPLLTKAIKFYYVIILKILKNNTLVMK